MLYRHLCITKLLWIHLSFCRWYCRSTASGTADGDRTMRSLPRCVLGNAITSRRLEAEVSSVIKRSKPVPTPASAVPSCAGGEWVTWARRSRGPVGADRARTESDAAVGRAAVAQCVDEVGKPCGFLGGQLGGEAKGRWCA